MGDEDPPAMELLLDAPDERGLPVAARREDDDVLAVSRVGDELRDLLRPVGERVVERERAVAERIGQLGHTERYYTRSDRTG